MNKAKVILLSIIAACGYGVVHDQITARLCIEYFTVAHPPLFHTTSPTLLALCWGIAATAAIGAGFGIVLALVSQSGSPPPYPVSRLFQNILLLLSVMALSAFIAAVAGYQLSQRGFLSDPAGLMEAIPAHQHHRFRAVWFAHIASYLVGLGGATVLCLRVWRQRGCPSVISLFPRTRAAAIRAVIVVAIAASIVWICFIAH